MSKAFCFLKGNTRCPPKRRCAAKMSKDSFKRETQDYVFLLVIAYELLLCLKDHILWGPASDRLSMFGPCATE